MEDQRSKKRTNIPGERYEDGGREGHLALKDNKTYHENKQL